MKIHTIDLNFQGVSQTIAAYLVVGSEGPVLVETGPASTLQNLQAELANLGYQPTDIKHVLVTHIHLDHSGAAGWWAQQGAQVYVHPVGAPHLIEPDKLLASAARIYGDKMGPLWGETVPAPAEQVTAVTDGEIISVAGFTFTAIETPGHAYHHHVYRLQDVAFMGDMGGIHMPGVSLIDAPGPPPEFNLEAWEASLDKLLAEDFRAIYLGHFGLVENVAEHLTALKKLLRQTADFIRMQMEAGRTQEQIVASYSEWNRERAQKLGLSDEIIHQYKTASPWYMTVSGIMRYWRKQGVA
jgi:glyoxylase-like metal-dependent hydrolase (beta-lactamase superfamily II)